MRRWLARILICLALGAVTTVGVAWGLVLVVDPVNGAAVHANCIVNGEHLFCWRSKPLGSCLALFLREKAPSLEDRTDPAAVWELVPAWMNAKRSEEFLAGDTTQDVYYADGRGFPALALWLQRVRVHRGPNEWSTRHGVVLGLPARHQEFAWYEHPKILPLRPLWPGFTLDTLFYGIFCLALLFGPGAARRALRTRRGRCPMCGYDLRGDLDAGCPECGWNRGEDEA